MLFAILVVAHAAIQAPPDTICTDQTCPLMGTKCRNDPDAGGAVRCIDKYDGYWGSPCMFGKSCDDYALSCLDIDKICYRKHSILCYTDTRDVMVAIKDEYHVTGVTKTSAKVGDTFLIFDDFATNTAKNLAYEFACKDKGAKYVELHYTATCETPAVAEGTQKKVILFVSGQPRCYSTAQCHFYDGENERLLYLFSILPTEERAIHESKSNEKWTCTGTIREKSLTLCKDMSSSVSTLNGIKVATIEMKPVLTVQKSLGLVKEEKLLSFVGFDSARFKTACEAANFAALEADGRLVCGKAKFDVKKYAICQWPLCGGVGSDYSRTLIATELHGHLVKSGDIQNKTKCEFSSASRAYGAFAAMLFGVVGSMLI